jgi:hypothetical protein
MNPIKLLPWLISISSLGSLVLAEALAQESPVVIKLEDTIRGDQEQPKVLSIVPWQTPSVKPPLPSPILERINLKFAPLERAEFSRELQQLIEKKPDDSYTQQRVTP